MGVARFLGGSGKWIVWGMCAFARQKRMRRAGNDQRRPPELYFIMWLKFGHQSKFARATLPLVL
jgi:hypothetical protein